MQNYFEIEFFEIQRLYEFLQWASVITDKYKRVRNFDLSFLFYRLGRGTKSCIGIYKSEIIILFSVYNINTTIDYI